MGRLRPGPLTDRTSRAYPCLGLEAVDDVGVHITIRHGNHLGRETKGKQRTGVDETPLCAPPAHGSCDVGGFHLAAVKKVLLMLVLAEERRKRQTKDLGEFLDAIFSRQAFTSKNHPM